MGDAMIRRQMTLVTILIVSCAPQALLSEPGAEIQTALYVEGYRCYEGAMLSYRVDSQGDPLTWNALVQACKSLGLSGDLTWVGGAAPAAYWVSTTRTADDSAVQLGTVALIVQADDGGWQVITQSSWMP